jgi:hypothetical protein
MGTLRAHSDSPCETGAHSFIDSYEMPKGVKGHDIEKEAHEDDM